MYVSEMGYITLICQKGKLLFLQTYIDLALSIALHRSSLTNVLPLFFFYFFLTISHLSYNVQCSALQVLTLECRYEMVLANSWIHNLSRYSSSQANAYLILVNAYCFFHSDFSALVYWKMSDISCCLSDTTWQFWS